MHKNSGLTMLNWQQLVQDTIKARKLAGITQKRHAALAGVSIPTMIAFERAETTLSIAKIMDIIDVVGLLDKEQITLNTDIEKFAEASKNRWLTLVNDLPQNSVARHKYGYYTYTYQIVDQSLKNNELLLQKMQKAAEVKYSGWTPFNIFNRPELGPYQQDGCIECWLKSSCFNMADTPDTTDFWRASASVYLHLHRGYREDTDTVEPGKKFDLDFNILRIGEFILHISRLARLICAELGKDESNVTIKVLAEYNGLLGRNITSLDSALYKNFTSMVDKIKLSREFKLSDINLIEIDLANNQGLINVVHDLLSTICSVFGLPKLDRDLVAARLAKFRPIN